MHNFPRAFLVARADGQEPQIVFRCPHPGCGGYYEVTDRAALDAAQRQGRASNADVFLIREDGSRIVSLAIGDSRSAHVRGR